MARMSRPRYSDDEVLSRRPVRLAYIGVLCTGLVYAWISHEAREHPGAAETVSVLSLLTGVLVITSRHPGRLSPAMAGAVAVCSLLSVTLLLARGYDHSGAWFIAFASYLLAMLVVRGNHLIAGIGETLLLLGLSAWIVVRGYSFERAFSILALPTIATLLAWSYHAMRRFFVTVQSRALAALSFAAAKEREAERADAIIQAEMQLIGGLARRVLQDLSDGKELTAELRTEILAVEGEIRDRIRSSGTIGGALTDAIAEARRRGVQVVLLGEDFRRIRGAAESSLVRLLSDERLEKATIRALSPARPGLATVLLERNGRTELLPLA